MSHSKNSAMTTATCSTRSLMRRMMGTISRRETRELSRASRERSSCLGQWSLCEPGQTISWANKFFGSLSIALRGARTRRGVHLGENTKEDRMRSENKYTRNQERLSPRTLRTLSIQYMLLPMTGYLQNPSRLLP